MDALADLLFGTGPIHAVQHFFGRGRPLPFLIVSVLGDTWGMIFAVGLAFWILGRRTAYALVGVVVLGAMSWILLSGLFGVPRPSGPDIVVYERIEADAFPSGHVYHAVSVWGLLYALGRVPLLVPALITLLVGVGRIYLGTHYLADVLGGVVFGLLLVWIYRTLWPKAWGWLSRRTWPLFLGLVLLSLAVGIVWLPFIEDHLRRWEVVGMTIAVAVGLPLEYRYIHLSPAPVDGAMQVARIGVGLVGIVVLALVSRGLAFGTPWPSAVAAGLGVLWAILGAPALFLRWTGLSRR